MANKRHPIAGAVILAFILIALLFYARAAILRRGHSIVRGYVKRKSVGPNGHTITVWGANARSEDMEKTIQVKKRQYDQIHAGDVYSYSPVTDRWFTYGDDPTMK
jgi:hypothetical protein